MNFEDISRLIELVDKSSLAEFSWSSEGQRLLLRKPGVGAPVQMIAAPAVAAPVAAPVAAVAAPAAPVAPVAAAPAVEAGLVEVRSPMVGTFYRSSSPDAAPYVEEGSKIEKGKPVCIIEAMKLMNEIESEVSGTIAKICVANESPVEFGTVLFLVRPA